MVFNKNEIKAAKIVLNRSHNPAVRNFDKTYMNSMITGHKEALVKLNAKIQEVRDGSLTNHLLMTSQHVAVHLKKTENIEQRL
ncbi:MAG: DUF4142 domain-containing protein [Gammaproteobacteria bacterium]|nr:DUF4142 domain-containing protein [Gammaproteobacteria bacterium]